MASLFQGGCLCGAIRYSIARKHLNARHCYCDMCRRAHGTAFSTHVLARPDQVSFVSGTTARKCYESSTDAFREFCPVCGTHMLVHGQSGDGSWAIPAGTLDGDPEIHIRGHMFTAERVRWHQITDSLPQHPGWPPGFGGNAS